MCIGCGYGFGGGGIVICGYKGVKFCLGYFKKIGFEGGQMLFQCCVLKFGFKNINCVEYKVINLDIFQMFVECKNFIEIIIEVMCENGLIFCNDFVKVLGCGELKVKLSVIVYKFFFIVKVGIEVVGGNVLEI